MIFGDDILMRCSLMRVAEPSHLIFFSLFFKDILISRQRTNTSGSFFFGWLVGVLNLLVIFFQIDWGDLYTYDLPYCRFLSDALCKYLLSLFCNKLMLMPYCIQH